VVAGGFGRGDGEGRKGKVKNKVDQWGEKQNCPIAEGKGLKH